ncbi:Gfo/Idh/MocA family oxidoreductase [Streptomyces sp. F63]|uniref:Gfo/Idh/MocA family protein n=1 Tax=Streptomyces sp. F63 TaxID=2824887 RepID=UPI001B39B5EF|nr:Gfo/Idh/MocA family oxidoreductase [Streptomyces sp. F63]MBQ0983663.1 Gfo/Idh/MocA family oxidoreductase [Streptomyces sp. F63]
MSTRTSAGTGSRPPLRVGLVGYGLAGSVFHAPLIAATGDLVLDTIVTTSPGRREQARAEHPGVRFADSHRELLSRTEGRDALDLVVVASPNRTHVPIATDALRAGLPVVVDKPLSATAAEARALAALAEERGLLLSVFQNRRWDNDFRTVQQLLAEGELGDVQRFESRFERWRPKPKGGWRESGDPEEIGGLLYDLGSHLVDQALVLFGPAVRVYAESAVRRPGAEADDDTFIAVTHANGVNSHLWMSATTAQLGPRFRVLGSSAGYVKYGLDPQEQALRDGLRPPGTAGTPGTAGAPGTDTGTGTGTGTADTVTPDIGTGASGTSPVDASAWGVEPESLWGRLGSGESPVTGGGRAVPTLPGDYPAYYAAVAAALRDGTPPPVTAPEAAAALDVLEAARRSAQEGRAITP